MFKIPKQEYTAEFKDLVVKRVRSGQSLGAVAKSKAADRRATARPHPSHPSRAEGRVRLAADGARGAGAGFPSEQGAGRAPYA